MDPVYTSITEEQCQQILNICRDEYKSALSAGWLQKSGPEQCNYGRGPRFFNIVDLAFYVSLADLSGAKDHTGMLWDFCFAVFDTILDPDIEYVDDWYLQIKNEKGEFFNAINAKREEVEQFSNFWAENPNLFSEGERAKWSNTAIYQACINAFADIGLRTQLVFHSLKRRDAVI